ncbi:MAG: CoA-transferase [Chloroflexota bacterium]|nr:CoA-transferase [Chloroflexota bacterium]
MASTSARDVRATVDLMAVCLSRCLRDGERAFHGVVSTLPMVAVLLAQRTHAPNLVYLNTGGSVDPLPGHLPASTSDPALFEGTPALFDVIDVFDLSARGGLDVVFHSGIQIDRFGRINLSSLGGDYRHPKVRLPGGAGSAHLMPTAKRVILWRTRHDRDTFVESVSFVTASGNVDRVVTPLCVFRKSDGQLELESIHPGVTFDDVQSATAWPLQEAPTTPAPTQTELAALEAVDPERIRDVEFGRSRRTLVSTAAITLPLFPEALPTDRP